MNRIICDICGSEYPETVERCPVCNYPRQGTEKLVAAESEVVQSKVKGGRFSSKNVKKRQKAQRKAARSQGEGNPNKPLIIVIILLLIAILLVSAYIGMRFLRGRGDLPALRPSQTTASTAAATESTAPPAVPCQGLVVESNVLDLETLGEQKQIAVTAVPGDSTDVLTFVSADPAVVQVDDTGLITAMGSGQTTITVTCGDVVKTCTVVCWFQPETTAPVETTEPTPTETKATEPKETEPAVLKLDPEDVSCFTAGETFTLYARLGGSTVSRSKVTWSTSDSKIATVENGTVTAMGKGTATIIAEYNGQKAYCTVRCRFEDDSETEPTEGREEQPAAGWKASHSDVSISVGESFRLTVKNSEGKTADAIWTQSQEGIVSVEGKTITGRAPGTVTLTTTVEGVTFTCIVRVK